MFVGHVTHVLPLIIISGQFITFRGRKHPPDISRVPLLFLLLDRRNIREVGREDLRRGRGQFGHGGARVESGGGALLGLGGLHQHLHLGYGDSLNRE